MKITTETGSYYTIKNGRWSKNGSGYTETVWWGHSIPDGDYNSWAEVDAAEKSIPTVGMRLYIGSKDVWWLSTKIVSIEDED